ncbi:hypothetical protein JCM1840_006566 [Sporobolomyces johnsonii]
MRRSPRMRELSELAAPHLYTFPDTKEDLSSEPEHDACFSETFAAGQYDTGAVAPRHSPVNLGQSGPRSPTPRSRTSLSPGWLLDPLALHSSPPLKRRSAIPLPEPSPCSTTFRIHDESGCPTYYGTSSLPMPPSPYSSESSALGFTPPSPPTKSTLVASSSASAFYSAPDPPPSSSHAGSGPSRPHLAIPASPPSQPSPPSRASARHPALLALARP